MKKKFSSKVLITLENFVYGGTTTHLISLINSKVFNDTFFYIVTNKNNKSTKQILKSCDNKRLKIIYFNTFNAITSNNFYLKLLHIILRPILFIFSIIQMFFLIRNLDFKFLIADCGGYGGFRSEMASIIAAKLLNKSNLFLIIHHCYAKTIIWSSIVNLFNLILGACLSGVVFVSNATKKSIERNTTLLSLFKKKIIVIQNGIQLRTIKKKKLKFFKKNKKIYFAGMLSRIETYKGQIDLIEAFNNLSEEKKKLFKIYLIGGGTNYEINKINNLIKKYNLKNFVRRTNYINEDSLLILKNFDIYYSLTRDFEGFGYSIAESLYVSTPVVATKVGGVVEFLNNKNSTLINPGDIKSITKSFEDFLNNKKIFMKKSINGKQNVIKKLNSDIMSKKYRNYFNKNLRNQKI